MAEAARRTGEDHFEMAWEGQQRQVTLLPLSGAAGRLIGRVMAVRDTTGLAAAHSRAEWTTLTVSLVIAGLLSGFFYIILGPRRASAAGDV